MAFVVGVGLLILCLEVVLHYVFDNDVLAWWSPVHGLLYMAYLVTSADLGLKARWSLPRLVAVMLAGVVPLFSFVMERRVARDVAAGSTLAR
jgi:integral membrane protein